MVEKNIRIKDIARLAGVSVGTVDRVLHNRGRVSPEALQKVTAVMEQIEYKPNLLARTLGSNKNHRLVTILPDPNRDPYWMQSNQGVLQAQSEWAQYGIQIEQIAFNQLEKSSFEQVKNQLAESSPDGILIAPIFYHEALPIFEIIHERNIPYVLINTNIPEAKPLSFIGQNLNQSGRLAAELMLYSRPKPGTFTILHIDEDISNSIHLNAKGSGFSEFIQERTQGEFKIVELSIAARESNFGSQLDSVFSDPTLQGVFVTTSRGTAVVAGYLQKHGKREIRMIGYDMLPENLKFLRTGIIDFLINQNPKRQAFLGISHLVNHLMFKKVAPEKDLFPLEVISQQNVESYIGSGIH